MDRIIMAKTYCAWLISEAGFREHDLFVTEVHETGDRCGSVRALTLGVFGEETYVSVPIPNPSMEAWKARIDAVVRPTRRRQHITCGGIKVKMTWNWTARREREVRQSMRALAAPWGWERTKLFGHPATLEDYAKSPL